MKRTIALIITAIVSLLAVSCKPKVTEGTLVEKQYHPSWVHLQPCIVGETVTLIPITMPATWEIVIENDGIRENFYVSKEAYDTLRIGRKTTVSKKDKKKK